MKDKYQVYIRKEGTRVYYKNGLIHREAGPAVVRVEDIELYTNLSDKGLHEETFKQVANDMFCASHKDYKSNVSSYFLEGKLYEQDEFDIIIFNKRLEKELPLSELNDKKVKI